MIGIFDSGVGGMTVARTIEQLLPDYPLLYLGDLARTPYGTKSSQTIIDYSVDNTRFLVEKGAELIVVGCNSAASVATEALRKTFNIPIVEVISPAVELALKLSRTGRIGIIGTRATVRSEIYKKKIKESKPEYQVFSEPCPLLVPLVEEGWINKRETKMVLRRYLYGLKNKQIDTLVLGCTHYPLLGHLIQPRIGKKVTLVDSSVATAEYLRTYLQNSSALMAQQTHKVADNKYFVTDLTDNAYYIANKIFDRKIDLLPARLT